MGVTLCFLLLAVATALGQEAQPSGQSAPTRSYAQAAVPKQQQAPPAPAYAQQQPPANPSGFSYAQAARGGAPAAPTTAPEGSQPPTPTPQTSWANRVGGGGAATPTTPPRSAPTPQNSWASRVGGGGAATTPQPPRRVQQQHRATTAAPGASSVSDDDLRTFSEDLLRSDTNNAAAAVRANWQGRTYGSNAADLASQPLLTIPARVLQGTTAAKLKQLYDNYEPDSSLAEVVTAYERDEDKAFLDAVMTTQVMAKTKRFLAEKGLIEDAPSSLRNKLHSLWFTIYPRLGGGSALGSSAFEHIFLAEVKRGEISGFHNWMYFAHEESTGKADYLGHIRHIDLGGKGSVVKHHFKWGNITKPVGSMFIGTSPELEMALYTVCFMARPDNKCPVRLGGEPFNIKTHSFTYRGNKYIGSAFPDI